MIRHADRNPKSPSSDRNGKGDAEANCEGFPRVRWEAPDYRRSRRQAFPGLTDFSWRRTTPAATGAGDQADISEENTTNGSEPHRSSGCDARAGVFDHPEVCVTLYHR